MSKTDVNSHIQMPKCVLKRFENQNHSFYYYDVEKNIIGNNGHAKTINTQFGYYSKNVEEYLNNNIEAPFSSVLEFINNTAFNAPYFKVNSDFLPKVRTFVYALLARSPMLLKEIDKGSVYYQFLSTQDQHDLAAIAGIQTAHEKGFFDTYLATFSVNKTETPFVLPMCGIYSYTLQDSIHLNLPVTPQIAITLVEPKGVSKLLNKDILSMYSIEERSAIARLNGLAFRAQCNAGWGYVVSPDKTALEELLDKIIV